MNLKINPAKTFKLLLLSIVVIVIANSIVLIAKINFNYYDKFIFDIFNLDEETNLPTYFSTIILFFSAFLLAFISFIHKKNDTNYLLWMFLAICFLFLSIDEFTSIHERIGVFLENKFNFTGALYFAWIIPYGIFAVVFAVIYFKYFLLKLPKKIRNLFIISGVIYVLGAIGFEMLGSMVVSDIKNPSETLISTLYTFEETFEMLGIAFLIYTLLIYFHEELEFTINVKSN